MLIYTSTRAEFSEEVRSDRISEVVHDAYRDTLKQRAPQSEINAWTHSLQHIENVLDIGQIAGDAGVAIEFQIPLTSKRIDFMLSGRDEDRQDSVVIVELKQWLETQKTKKEGVVQTILGGARVETTHPSYQAWTYAAFIEDYNLEVQTSNIQIQPCAYLHNCKENDDVASDFYDEDIQKAPLFLKHDSQQLADFLGRYVKYGDKAKILYRIENSKLRPSKRLIDHLSSLLQGNEEFTLIDEQKLVYETALDLAKRANEQRKHVMLVHGGPGTGKSVVAVNLLEELTKREKVAHYVTRNTAPREVYDSKLSGTFKKTVISNLFKGAGSFVNEPPQKIDALLVDEAHRLSPRSGPFGNQGENQVMEIIRASNLAVFFLDRDQKVLWNDIGDSEEIRNWALKFDATITEMRLPSQFRCSGSDGYLSWVNSSLQFDDSVAQTFDGITYDFRVFDSPNKLRNRINELSTDTTTARMVAGFCWDWKGRKDPELADVTIPEHDFAMRWNLNEDGPKWIITPGSEKEIGCIHTCQGLELDYVGVIVGRDLVVRDSKVQTNPAERSKDDRSMRGFKRALGENPTEALKKADQIIKNTYCTLMTRGLKGCYIYCVDEETNDYFKNLVER